MFLRGAHQAEVLGKRTVTARLTNPRFELLEELPSSSPGGISLYKARDAQLGAFILLRVIPDSAVTAPDRVLADVRQCIQDNELLSIPGVAKVVDCGRDTAIGEMYLAAEYVRGITLRERIRRVAPFSLTIATEIAAAIAETVAAAHRSGVVHGALSPSCIVLSPDSKARVTDFGLSRAAHAAFALEGPSGLEPYLDSRTRRDAPRSGDDIFALGVILFEMLTGSAPIPGEKTISARNANASVPTALEGIVQKATHADAASRYRDMGQMLADLQEVAEALKAGKPLTWSPLTAKPARAPRPSRAATAGSLTAAAAELEKEREIRYKEPANPLTIAVWVLLLFVVLGVLGVGYQAAKNFAVPNNVVVPNLIGKTVDDSRAIAKQLNFELVEGGSDYSTKWPENQIYKQDPQSGNEIKAGRPVTYFRSLGPRLLTVPDLKGMTKERAIQALEDASLPPPTVDEQYSASVQKGNVITQSLQSGTTTARGTIVSISVSKGAQPPDMPADVQASPVTPTQVNITWTASARAVTYSVTRREDGTDTVIVSALKSTQYTDSTAKPESVYYYMVTAFNSAGDSGPSDLVGATTPPILTESPTMPDTVHLTPPPDPSSDPPTAGDVNKQTQMRQFEIAFRVPRRPRGERHVQIELQDATGTFLVYDEHPTSGTEVNPPVTAFGNKITFRIFVDGKLVRQKTL